MLAQVDMCLDSIERDMRNFEEVENEQGLGEFDLA